MGASFKKMLLDKQPAEKQTQARRVVRYFLCIVQEAMNSFGKADIDGKGIKGLQEALVCVGFPKSAERIFAVWKENQQKLAQAAAEAAAAAEKEKGGKDDKK